MSNANPKTDTADEPSLRLVDESSLDNEDNVNNVGDVVGKIELIQEPEPEPEVPVDEKKVKVKGVKEAEADWGDKGEFTIEEINKQWGSFDAYVKEMKDEGIEVRIAGDEVRVKQKSLKAMGSVFIDKCKKDVAPIVKEFQDALLDPDVVASVQFAKDMTTGNQNLFNGLGVAYKLGLSIDKLDVYHKEAFFQELKTANRVQIKYSKPIMENPFIGVVNVMYFDVDPPLKSKYTSILSYAKKLDKNPDLFSEWLGTTVFEWNDNDGKRCTGTGYTSCLKEIAYNRKINKGEVKPDKVGNEIPTWCFGKTNASVSIDIPDFWDKAKQKEGMALFRIEDGKLRLYNVTTSKPSTIVKIVRENYGKADETSYDGTQSELTQFMNAVKKIIEISKPNAIMIAQEQNREYKWDNGDITYGPGSFYVVPLYGCYQDDVTPHRRYKKGENPDISPLVVIPNSSDCEIPDFPEYSAYLTAEKMEAEDYIEERGIFQCAYYTTDIKALVDWDETIQPEIRYSGTSGGQFWFMDALFRHMDHTQDYMPHHYIHSKPDQRLAAKLGHRLQFGSGAHALDKYFAELKKLLDDDKKAYERITKYTHIIVENGVFSFWWPGDKKDTFNGAQRFIEKSIKFGQTDMKEVRAVWVVPTAALRHLFKIGGEWRILLNEKHYNKLKEQYAIEGNWKDNILTRPTATFLGVPFICQRKYLHVVIDGSSDQPYA